MLPASLCDIFGFLSKDLSVFFFRCGIIQHDFIDNSIYMCVLFRFDAEFNAPLIKANLTDLGKFNLG